MKIKWHENARCWHGTAKKTFPQFEAWRSAEYADGPWCLNVLKSPNAGPIAVRCLQSLDAVKQFAQELLAEFVYMPEANLPATIARNAGHTHKPQSHGTQPQPA